MTFTTATLRASETAEPRDNLARGRTVEFSPRPDYGLTAKGDSDATDLTDGELCKREDLHAWFESGCVGWQYPGLCQLWLDLGSVQPIGEIAIRFMGGSPNAGGSFPESIDAAASLDGYRFYRLDSYSRRQPGDREKFQVPRDAGKAVIHGFRFEALNVRARYVAVVFYGSGLVVSDELYVYPAAGAARQLGGDTVDRVPVARTRGIPYFHKPELLVADNIFTPLPIGLLRAPRGPARAEQVWFELPPGIEIHGEAFRPVTRSQSRFVADVASDAKPSKNWQRAWWKAAAANVNGIIRYGAVSNGIAVADGEIPVRTVTIRARSVPKRLVSTLGWWGLSETMKWPGAVEAMRAIGLNTASTFAHWDSRHDDQMALLERLRANGFRVLNVDSPFHRIPTRPETRCQLPGGETSSALCPSYRGPLYTAELARVAGECARCRPDLVACDIELWNWRGPVDARACARCQADFARSGLADWGEWQLRKGHELWTDLAKAVRKAVSAVGAKPPELGGYDFRAGRTYQFTWPFDRLYPEWMQSSQVSTYTDLQPYGIETVGDEAREDRGRLPRSDVIPWITPGDAGTFPGRALRYALWECYANGARGVYFWSSRVWDTESFAAFADAMSALAAHEDIIIDGELLENVTTSPSVRVSGVRKAGGMLLLIADYWGDTRGDIRVTLPLPLVVDSVVTDCREDLAVAHAKAGESSFTVRFPEGENALLLSLEPAR